MGSPDLSNVLIVMDFDGTVTTSDRLRSVLSHHVEVLPALLGVAREAGLSETETLVQAVAQLGIPRTQLLKEFADAATLRDGFHDFLGAVLERGARASLISVGFIEGIEAVWRREDLPPVTMLASALGGDEQVGYRLHVDERFGDCPMCGKGMCKGPAVDALRRSGDVVLAFGDSARDLCMARRADLVFARDRLAELCVAEGMRYRPLTDFRRAGADIEDFLEVRGSRPHSSQ
jgi:2-hydroxy-3-keto-5-methylthiopentenyl-1-phosphate phosphatase